MPSKAYIRDYYKRKRQGGPWGRARFKKARSGGRFKSKYGRKRKRVSVPKKRMRKKALVRSKFHYAPKDKEVPLTLVNDEPLILQKPPALLTNHRLKDENANTTWSLPFLSGATEPNFRFLADLGAVQQQIRPYLQLYKEFKITGVTLTFKPTWTRKGLIEGLKQRVQTSPQTSITSRHVVSEIPCRIPSGWFPRIYYRLPKYGEMSDLRTMMPNQAMAREFDASSKSLLGPQTFKYVPKMYKNTFDSSGMPVTRVAGNVGWLPTDDAFKRSFGGMDFCISPFPNFDYLSNEFYKMEHDESDDFEENPDTDNLHKRLFGNREMDHREEARDVTKNYADDSNPINDQYVIVNRTYHILMRGRKTKYWNDDAWASGDYDVKPTSMEKIGWFHNKRRVHEKTGLDIMPGNGGEQPNVSVMPQKQHDEHPEFRDITMAADTGMSREDARSMKKDAMIPTDTRVASAVRALAETRSVDIQTFLARVAPIGNTNPSFFNDNTDGLPFVNEVDPKDEAAQAGVREPLPSGQVPFDTHGATLTNDHDEL